MEDETLSRIQATCAHDWQFVSGTGKQCPKCSLLWETWAERRLAKLEEILTGDDDEDDEDDEDDDGGMVLVAFTLLPPQTPDTCAACNGTGQRPFGDCVYVCGMCACTYESEFLRGVVPATLLQCGHRASVLYPIYACQTCGGEGRIK